MKPLATLTVAMLLAASLAFGQNHGVTLTWTASTSASTCTLNCTSNYLIFEGSSSGAESTTTFGSSNTTSFTDNGPTLNAYSGTTRCYTVKYQETLSGAVMISTASNEACFSFPPATTTVTPPTALGGTIQ